ncbi:MAG: hypothetical protein ACE366_22045 [Bradymonadia bacterium]
MNQHDAAGSSSDPSSTYLQGTAIVGDVELKRARYFIRNLTKHLPEFVLTATDASWSFERSSDTLHISYEEGCIELSMRQLDASWMNRVVLDSMCRVFRLSPERREGYAAALGVRPVGRTLPTLELSASQWAELIGYMGDDPVKPGDVGVLASMVKLLCSGFLQARESKCEYRGERTFWLHRVFTGTEFNTYNQLGEGQGISPEEIAVLFCEEYPYGARVDSADVKQGILRAFPELRGRVYFYQERYR